MPNESNKILKHNYGEKSLKGPFIIYADLEYLLEKIFMSKYLWKIFYRKKTKPTSSGYSIFTSCSSDLTKNKLDCYKGEGCMEIFCKDLGEHAVKIMNYEKKEVIPIINEENELYEMQKVCYICRKISSPDKSHKNVFNLYHKVRDHCHYTG